MECSNCHYQSSAKWQSCPACGAGVSQGFFAQIKKMFVKPAPSGMPVRPSRTGDSPAKSAFSLRVEEIFTLREGLTVAGRVAGGAICKGDEVIIQSASGASQFCRILAIKKFRNRVVDVADVGENVGLVLSEVSKKDVARNDIIRKTK